MDRLNAIRCGFLLILLISPCWGQETSQPVQQPEQTLQKKVEATLQNLRDIPAEWLIGPYIPSSKPLVPLTGEQRVNVYFHQTYLTAGAYVLRMFTAGIDQARGVPSQWGGGMSAYGKRFGSRYGQFMISNTLVASGNAALGYESRYDICRCRGFWPRTRHAISRNFVVYNRTESELRFAAPLYVGSFSAGMLSTVWLPGNRSVWREGAYGALGQAGWGSAYNFASEFAVDILRKITKNKYPRRESVPK